MSNQYELQDHYRKNPNAETPAPGKTINDVRIAHEVAKKNAGK